MDSSNKKINWAKEIGKSLPAIAVATMGVQANASAPVSSRSRLQNKAWISEQSSSMAVHHNDVFNGFSNQPEKHPADITTTQAADDNKNPDVQHFLKQLKKKRQPKAAWLSGHIDNHQASNNPNFIGKTKASGTCSFTGFLSYCTSATSQSCTTDADCNFGGNNAPTDIGLDNSSIGDASTGTGAVIGNLSTTDADGGDTHTYSLVTNGASGSGSCGASGDDDNASFQVDNANDDLETAGSVIAGNYNVCVQTHDGTDSYQKTFAITVSDTTAPGFENSTPSVNTLTLTGGTVAVDLNEEGTAYYVVVTDGAGAPSASQVKAGQDSGGGAALASGSFTTSGTTGSEAFTGLSSGTAYDLYAVAEDDEGSPNLQAAATLVNFTTNTPDSDGDLTASGTVSEPVGLDTTVDTVGEAVDVFDFTLSDGGTTDGLAMAISQVVINVSGTSTDTERGNITWRLNGNDASNVTGVYNSGSDTITFSGLSISVADGASEVYSVNAYFNNNSSITEDNTVILSVDGDTDLTVGGSGTQMGSTSAVTNGSGTTLDVVASALVFTTQPSGSTSGSALSTQPVVTAQDTFGNTDVDFTETVTLTEASAGSLSGDLDIAAVSGVATFTDVAYTATADQQNFTLTANDEDATGSNLSTVDANAVTADVVATKLIFDTQPSPLTVNSGQATAFSTVPVVSARDANNVVDTGYSTDITLAEVNGAGSATMTGTDDKDGNGATVSITPSSGVSTFTSLSITYTASGGSSETFNLQASSGGLTSANSSQLTGLVPDTDGDLVAAGGVSEPVTLNLSVDTVGEAVDLFDFTISDGGSADGSALSVSAIVVNVSGTSSDTERSNITWRLNGNDASNVTGVYNSGSDTITFSGLSISVADGGSETYTVNGYYNDTGNMTHGHTVILSVDGDTDLTLGSSGTQMGSTSAVNNGTGTVINDDIAPTVDSVSVPANATYVAGNNLDFTVNFDENITVNTGAGTPRLALTVGATTRYASYLSGSGSSALMFRYTVVSGDEDTDGISLSASLEPNSGTLQDVAGNDASNSLNTIGSLTSVLVDAVAPVVAEVTAVNTPANDTTPSLIVSSDEAGTLAVGGSCGSSDEGAVSSGNNTITLTQPDNSTPLSAGTYTDCTVTVTDAAGNASNVITATPFTIDLSAPSGHSVNFDDNNIGDSEAGSIAFTFAAAETGAGYSYTISSSGGGSDVTGSGIISTASDNINNIDVSGLGDGTLTLSVVLTDSSGNAATAVTDTTTLDTTAPSGHSISFDDSTINNTEASSQSFTFANAETGAAYSYTISSAGGGTNVTGSGTLSTTSDQITGLDLSGLGDGSLTLSVVLTDSAGNAAAAETDNATLDSNAPTINSFSPADNSASARYDTDIILTFSETIVAGSSGDLSLAIYKTADNSLVESNNSNSAAVTISGNSATLNPTSNLSPAEDYYVRIGAGAFTDSAGNPYSGIADNTTLNFSTTNLAPITIADNIATNEDNAVAIDVLTNDSDEDGALNPASVMIGSPASNGSTSINTANGVISYTPAADFNGSDNFSYTVEDNNGLASSATTVTVTVNAVNDAPVAVADLVSTPEDTALSIDVASNDTDVDSGDAPDTSTISLVSLPANGSAVINTGQVSYTPAANFNGSDSFSYTIEDNNGATSNAATVTINVTSVNDLPVASNDSVTTDEDNAVDIDVLTNDSDPDGSLNVTSVQIQTAPNNGNAIPDPVSGAIRYTPAADFNGSDSFSYTVRDDAGGTSNAATVNITVNSINDAPRLNNDSASLLEDNSHTINVLGNDTDIDGSLNVSSVEIVNTPASGSASVNNSNGTIIYTPGAGFNGQDTLSYRVQDDLGLWSAAATVTITVQPVNDLPLANDDTFSVDEDSSTTLAVLANDSDIDGTLNPTTITLTSAARHGSVSLANDGSLNYQPDNNFNGSDSFSYRVADDEGGLSNTATVSISVRAINDAPQISGTPVTSLLQGATYHFSPILTDVENDPLTVSAENLPGWLTLDSSSGTLSGSTDQVSQFDNIILTVSDGDASSSLAPFSITIQADSDGDGLADEVDSDDDNDGMSDEFELANHFNPLDASDAAADADGDGVSNLEEQNQNSNPRADDYPPVFATAGVVDINATGLLTKLPELTPPAAIDALDGAVTATLLEPPQMLEPGRHILTWRASDNAGNSAEQQQILRLFPLISLSKNQQVAEGGQAQFSILLNGLAPHYPFAVAYQVSGSASKEDHDLKAGSVQFDEGSLAEKVSFTTFTDQQNDPAETLVISLSGDGNFGTKNSHTTHIHEGNIAPKVALGLEQSGQPASLLIRNGDIAVLTAQVSDSNLADRHVYDWHVPGINADHTNKRQFIFQPKELDAGTYNATVTVTDNGNPAKQSSASLLFRILQQPPQLAGNNDSDGDSLMDDYEGFGDSDGDGQPDYLDALPQPNVLNEQVSDGQQFLIEADPGVQLRLGRLALGAGANGAAIDSSNPPAGETIPADNIDNVGGYFDFVITDLPQPGDSVKIVIPQRREIPPTPLYRKLDGSIWFTFVEDSHNQLASAPGDSGICPPPGHSLYQPGLTPGHWCVELTIEDGGPNDADHSVNGSVADPGGVGVINSQAVTARRSGGNVPYALLLALGLLALAGKGRRRLWLALALSVLAANSHSAAGQSDQIWPQWLQHSYIEAGLYRGDGTQDSGNFRRDMAQSGAAVELDNYQVRKTAYQLSLGYHLTHWLAADIGYINLGQADIRIKATAADNHTLEKALEKHYPVSGRGWTVSARLADKLTPRHSLSAELGVFIWQGDIELRGADIQPDSHGDSEPLLGVGLSQQLGSHTQAALRYRRIFAGQQAFNLLGISARLNF